MLQVAVEGVFDAVAVRVVIDARRYEGDSDQSYTARSENLCYQVLTITVTIKYCMGLPVYNKTLPLPYRGCQMRCSCYRWYYR